MKEVFNESFNLILENINEIDNLKIEASKNVILKISKNYIFKDNHNNKIIELILNDSNYFKACLNWVYKRGNLFILKNNTINSDEIRNYLKTKCGNNTKIKNYIYYIVDWVLNIDGFFNIDDIININDVKSESLLIKEFIPRENQKEAFDRLEKYGLETGIHCQATGCGKTFIILKYIDYCIRNFKKSNIILFTERVNILVDLFDFNNNEPNKNKINEWKKLGIADLTNINIINRATIKKSDWGDILKKSTSNTLIVINRAFLTREKIYKKLNNEDISLILHDECHNTTSKQCNNFLTHCKDYNIPIVGFSATPLRTGKDDLSKLMEIYPSENNNSLKLLTNYNMIYAVNKKLIIPPIFHWYESKDKWYDKKFNNIIFDDEADIVINLISNIINTMPNKKLVAWCGKINMAKKWKQMFENKKGPTNLKNFDFFLDTSVNSNEDYDKFKNLEGNAILFCAAKHREGSDIKKLDGCLFLDRVKNRGSIPFIQSIGRVLRKEDNKNNGVIIDCLYQSDKYYESDFIDKIISYYSSLENISDSISNSKSKLDKYIELKNIINFNRNSEEITLNLGNSSIKIYVNSIKWSKVVDNFDNLLQKKIKLSINDNLIHKSKILKDVFNFNQYTDFYNKYKNIPKKQKEKYNLPEIDSEDYQKLFNRNNWFKYLNIQHNFYSDIYNLKIALNKINLSKKNPAKLWKKYCEIDKKIPPYPKYVYDEFNYEYFKEECKNKRFFT